MRLFRLVPVLAATALCTGCLSPGTSGISIEGGKGFADRTSFVRVGDAGVLSHLRLVGRQYWQNTPEGFLEATVPIENTGRQTFDCLYRFVWLDARGLEDRHAASPWRLVHMMGRPFREDFRAVSPRAGIERYRFELRRSDTRRLTEEDLEAMAVTLLEQMLTDDLYRREYDRLLAGKEGDALPRVALGAIENNTGDGVPDALSTGMVKNAWRTILRKTGAYDVTDDAQSGLLDARNEAMSTFGGERTDLKDLADKKTVEVPDIYLFGELKRRHLDTGWTYQLSLNALDARTRKVLWNDYENLDKPDAR